MGGIGERMQALDSPTARAGPRAASPSGRPRPCQRQEGVRGKWGQAQTDEAKGWVQGTHSKADALPRQPGLTGLGTNQAEPYTSQGSGWLMIHLLAPPCCGPTLSDEPR